MRLIVVGAFLLIGICPCAADASSVFDGAADAETPLHSSGRTSSDSELERARILYREAAACFSEGDSIRAVQLLRECGRIRHAILGDTRFDWLGWGQDMATYIAATGDDTGAVTLLREVRKAIMKSSGDGDLRVYEINLMIGESGRIMGDSAAALEGYSRAEMILRSKTLPGAGMERARLLITSGRILSLSGETSSALSRFFAAADLMIDEPDLGDNGHVYLLSSLCENLKELGNKTAAIELCRRLSGALHSADSYVHSSAQAFEVLWSCQRWAGDKNGAAESRRRCLDRVRSDGGDSRNLPMTFMRFSTRLQELGEYQEALTELREALRISIAIDGETDFTAHGIRKEIASLLRITGQRTASIDEENRAQAVWNALNAKLGRNAHDMTASTAASFEANGDDTNALEYFRRAQREAEAARHSDTTAFHDADFAIQMRRSQARVLRRMGDFDSAVGLYRGTLAEEGDELRDLLGQDRFETFSRYLDAAAEDGSAAAGMREKIRRWWEEERLKHDSGIESAYDELSIPFAVDRMARDNASMGEIHLAQKEWPAALRRFRLAFSLRRLFEGNYARAHGDDLEIAIAMMGIATVDAHNGDHASARIRADSSLLLAARWLHPRNWESRDGRGRLALDLLRSRAWVAAEAHDSVAAFAWFETYAARVEATLWSMDGRQELATHQFRRHTNEWCGYLRSLGPDGIEKAFDYEERFRGLRVRSLSLAATTGEARAMYLKALWAWNNATEMERRFEDYQYTNKGVVVSVEQAWTRAVRAWDAFLAAFPGFGIRRPGVEILRRRLGVDEAAIRFSVSDLSTVIYLLTSEGIFAWENPSQGRALLRSRVEAFRRELLIPAGGGNYEADARQLYTDLLGELSMRLKKFRRIHIIPDGPLFHLPFDALDLGEEDKYVPWIERADIDIVPSFQRPSGDMRTNGRQLVYANPVAPGMLRLPGAEVEAELISYRNESAVIRVGMDASERALRRDIVDGPRAVHLACHAWARGMNEEVAQSRAVTIDDYLLDNALYLSPVRANSGSPEDTVSGEGQSKPVQTDLAEDGRLTMREIRNIHFPSAPPELIMLSACGTAMGVADEGDELLSLADAFHSVGIGHVVATLWPIPDMSTPRLVDNFYQEREDGMSDAAALAAAKRTMWSGGGGRYSEPLNWASFVLYRNVW